VDNWNIGQHIPMHQRIEMAPTADHQYVVLNGQDALILTFEKYTQRRYETTRFQVGFKKHAFVESSLISQF
jgi:hypothetical protein